MTITGYKWNNKAQAQGAENAAKIHFGIPVSPDAVTRKYFQASYDIDNDFYFYQGDLSPVFGSPIEFEISDNINPEPYE